MRQRQQGELALYKLRSISGLLLIIASLSRCSPETNPIGLTVPAEERDSFDALLVEAQVAYDSNDLEKALESAEKAFELDPLSEEAVATVGYIYLGLAGITPFGLVSALTNQEEESNGETTTSTEQSDEPASSSESEGGTGDVLGSLASILNIDDTKLGELNEDIPELPIIIPKTANDARESLDILGYINKAIKAACPFVDAQLRLEEEPRHQCVPASGIRRRTASIHFMWSLVHLVEAVAFHRVINYSTTNTGKSNLELRVDAIENIEITDPSQIPDFINQLNTLTTTIDRIIPIDSTDESSSQTQFQALLNDMISVSLGLSSIPGIPPEVSQNITQSMEGVLAIRDKTENVGSSNSGAEALKGDLTSNMAAIIGAKVNEADSSQYSESEKEAICSSYNDISGNTENDPNRPDICLAN